MKWLIFGASGLLGHSLCQYLESRKQHVVGLYNTHSIDVRNIECIKVDLTDGTKVESIITRTSPEIIVYAAGLTDVDLCESNEKLATILHADIPRVIATSSKKYEVQFVYISTDHLWNGKNPFITESTPTDPVNAYARTKCLGEAEVILANPQSLIIRTNFFGQGRPWRISFSDWIIQKLTAENIITAFTDSFFTPIGTPCLCSNIHELTQLKASGIYNVAGRERISKYEFALNLAKYLGLRIDLIKPGKILDAHLSAQRPSDMSLSVDKIETFLNKKMPASNECFKTLALEINASK
jgi:dTDP-4-dehydrorhamnose reductase